MLSLWLDVRIVNGLQWTIQVVRIAIIRLVDCLMDMNQMRFAATAKERRIDMAGWQLLLLGYFLGAPLGFLLCSVLVASKDPPKPHTTCKDCVHRNKKECPFSHIECDVTGDSIFWHTNKQDDFYCKEAQDIGLATKRK